MDLGRLSVFFQSQLMDGNDQGEFLQGFLKERGKWTCQRCGNHCKDRMAMGACCRCGGECLYCLECLQMGKVKQCSILRVSEEKTPAFEERKVEVHYKGHLSCEQQVISQKLAVLALERKGKEHLVWAVTGAGKTEMLFEAIRVVLEYGGRVCIAAPRIDVCQELGPRLESAFPDTEQIVLHGMTSSPYQRVPLTIATTHQLLRFYHAFDLLVIDEVDAFPYKNSQMLQYAVDRAVKMDGLRIYLTATPSEAELKRVEKGNLSVSLLPARYHRHPLVVPRFVWMGACSLCLKKHQLPKVIQEWIAKHLEKKIPFLLFVPTIEEIPLIELAIRTVMPLCRFTSVSSVEEERSQRVESMRSGQLDFLVTTTILERGVTFRGIDVAVIGAQERIFTREVLAQISGRVGRVPEYPSGEVVFFHEGISLAMKAAVREIQKMNQEAKVRGLLESDL